MNAKQSNKLASLNEVREFLNTNTATADLAALAPRVAQLNTYIIRINELAAIQDLPLAGPLDARDQAQEAAIKLTLSIAGPVRCYAEANERPELVALVDLSRADFIAIRKSERMRLAKRLLDAATPLAAQLAPFGVSAALLDELRNKINEGNSAALVPRTTNADKKAATVEMADTFSAIEHLLESEIDPLLTVLQATHPLAYTRYRIAREVIDRPGSRSSNAEAPADGAPAAATTLVAPATVTKAA